MVKNMSFQLEIDKAIKEKCLYFVGTELPSDWYAAAIQWTRLAEAGNPKAQFNMGRCYAQGDGVDENFSLAKKWYQLAEAQNEPRSLFNLHVLFSNKNFTENDTELSETYLRKAIAVNEPRALELSTRRKSDAEKKERNDKQREIQIKSDQHFEKIKVALANSNLEQAKVDAANAIADGFEWGKWVLSALNLVVSYETEKSVKKEVRKGDIVRGTTQYYNEKIVTYRRIVVARNPTSTKLEIRFPGTGGGWAGTPSIAVDGNSEKIFHTEWASSILSIDSFSVVVGAGYKDLKIPLPSKGKEVDEQDSNFYKYGALAIFSIFILVMCAKR
jgi:uncharacterized protein